MDRQNFLKLSGILAAGAAVLKPFESLAQQEKITHTEFKETGEILGNKQKVYSLEANGRRVGEFWPISTLNLVSRDIDPQAFQGEIIDIQRKLKGVVTTPDGMTSGSYGFQMEGKCLSNGVPCGDGKIQDTGIIVLDHKGATPVFTHYREIHDFNDFYSKIQQNQGTLFFLPSVYRAGVTPITSSKVMDKVFIRRTTPGPDQIGIVIFDKLVNYQEAREIIFGLDRPGKSTTQNIYMLDGAGTWGQCIKEDINGNVTPIGTRDASKVTNYLVFY